MGRVKDIATVNKSFARANLTLAKFYTEKAILAEAEQELEKVGYELQEALKYLKLTREWYREDGVKRTNTDKQINAVADRLINGQKEDNKTIKNAIDALKGQIEKLSREIG